MKKLLLTLALLALLVSNATAQQWYKANQATVGWDAVTTLSNGTTIPAGDTLKYYVYLQERKATTSSKVAESSLPQVTLTFNQEGFWFIGVQSVRWPQGYETEEPMVSTISWSNVAEVCFNGLTFGIRFHEVPGKVTGLKVQ